MVTASSSASWQPSASMDYVSEHTDVTHQDISRCNTVNTMSKQHELKFGSITNDNCKIVTFVSCHSLSSLGKRNQTGLSGTRLASNNTPTNSISLPIKTSGYKHQLSSLSSDYSNKETILTTQFQSRGARQHPMPSDLHKLRGYYISDDDDSEVSYVS